MRLDDLHHPGADSGPNKRLMDQHRADGASSRQRQWACCCAPISRPAKNRRRVAEAGEPTAKGRSRFSTLAEAAYFLKHGFRDITYAVGIPASQSSTRPLP